MKFKLWIRERSPLVVAQRLGIDKAAVYMWLRNKSSPGALTMQKLVRMGRGAFDYDDIINETKIDNYRVDPSEFLR